MSSGFYAEDVDKIIERIRGFASTRGLKTVSMTPRTILVDIFIELAQKGKSEGRSCPWHEKIGRSQVVTDN